MNINLKTNWKDYLLAVLAVIAGIAVLWALHLNQQVVTKEQLVKATEILENPKAEIVKRDTDRQGLNHVQIKTAANDIPAGTINDTTSRRKRLIDTVKDALNLKNVQQIEELTRENFSLKAQLKLRATVDSAGRPSLNYSDKWLNLSYNPLDSIVNLRYDASLSAVTINQRSWVPFSKRVGYTDFFGNDKRITINGVDHWRVIQPDPLFSFSADFKTSYFFNSGRIFPSAGLAARMGKLTLEAREFYSFKTNSFLPMASLSYRFINY